MPVRKIPKNYLMVTGVFSSAKNGKSLGYESLLERDLMILLEFDNTVQSFEEQPVKISYKVDGKAKKQYVPDILIRYQSSAGVTERTVLGETKHTDDLKKNKAKYAPKFEAAKIFATEQGWEWQIFTEKDIRTPFLENLKFLREYRSAEPDISLQNEVITCLQHARGSVTIDSVLEQLCPTDDRKLLVVPALWHLVGTKRITANLQKPLDFNTKLSLAK